MVLKLNWTTFSVSYVNKYIKFLLSYENTCLNRTSLLHHCLEGNAFSLFVETLGIEMVMLETRVPTKLLQKDIINHQAATEKEMHSLCKKAL